MDWLYGSDEYEPGAGFRQDIEYSYHVGGDPAPYVPCNYNRPDYNALNRYQLDFFYHFRDSVRRGEYPETDRGYIWLMLCEILVAEKDIQRGMSLAKGMMDAYIQDFPCNIILADFVYDYALANGLPLPISRMAPGKDMNDAMIGTMLVGPVFDLSAETLSILGAYEDKTGKLDQVEYVELVNRTLELLDNDSRHRRGRGILEWYGDTRNEVARTVFDAFGCVGESRRLIINYLSPFCNEFFGSFIENITKYCARQLLVNIAPAPKAQGLFDSDKEFVRQALTEMREDKPRIPYDSPGNPTTMSVRPARADEKPRGPYLISSTVAEETVYSSFDDDYGNLGSVMVTDWYAMDNEPSKCIMESLASYRSVSSEEPVTYTPSKFRRPDPSILSSDKLAYYVYWRTMTLKGVYLDTDQGYMWMRLCEIINLEKDPAHALELLMSLRDAYGSGREDILSATVNEYAVMMDLPIPNTESADNPIWIMFVMYKHLMARPIQDLSPAMFGKLSARIDPKYMDQRMETEFCEVANHALRMIDAHMHATTGRRVCDMIQVRPNTIRREMFRQLHYEGPNRIIEFGYRDLDKCEDLKELFTGIMKTVVRSVRKRKGLNYPNIPKTFPKDHRDVVEKAVDGWYTDRETARAMSRPVHIVLDTEAIESASADLDAVTQMMAVPEDDTDHVAEEVTVTVRPEVQSGTGWDALASSLDDDCRGYLSASLEGVRAAKTFVREHGLTVSTIEGRINDLAMDAVGDIIVEDCVVIEDYIDDVRGMLGL